MNEHVFTATIDEQSGIVLIRLNRNYTANDLEALVRPQPSQPPKRKK